MAHPTGASETEGGGDGYFASISDLMVGILFVFLLMLTVLALSYREAEQENRRLQLALDHREQARTALLGRLERELAARDVAFRIDPQSGVLRLSEDMPFDTGRSELTGRARRTVEVLSDVLMHVLPCFIGAAEPGRCEPKDAPVLEAVLIEGHTDRQQFVNVSPQLSAQENDRLSVARALAVFAEMRRLKPALDLLKNTGGVPLLGVSGYGERRPLPEALGATEQELARNRRIDLRFILSAPTSAEIRRLMDEVERLREFPG